MVIFLVGQIMYLTLMMQFHSSIIPKKVPGASLPSIEDEADLIPAGEDGIDQLNSEVDVFFVHPTGYLKDIHGLILSRGSQQLKKILNG
jgi:hypothetical protein